MKKALLFIVFAWAFYVLSLSVAPAVDVDVALSTVNGGDTEAAVARSFNAVAFFTILSVSCGLYAVFSLLNGVLKMMTKTNVASSIVLACVLCFAGGCGPYQTPEYATIDHNETAFVIPLEGDMTAQVKFESVKDLEGFKVNTKRILIPKRKSSTGRAWFDFEWIPMVKVITVNRSPITLILDPESKNASNDNGIWVESSDSVGFSTGFSITAHVDEQDAALFLYRYKGNSLETVMNTEVRARIQSVCTDFASREKMDLLRGMKFDMVAKIREEVVSYFKESGISITTIGSFGGFTYENPKIQESIDMVFVAQQEKEVAAAMLTAQKDKNERMKQEGEGEASKVMEVARGKAEAELLEAKGRASAIEMIAKATKEAGSDPLFIQIRTLEVLQEQVKRWDGAFPRFMMSSGDGKNNPMFMVPLPTSEAIEKN